LWRNHWRRRCGLHWSNDWGNGHSRLGLRDRSSLQEIIAQRFFEIGNKFAQRWTLMLTRGGGFGVRHGREFGLYGFDMREWGRHGVSFTRDRSG